jgi:hypothetical protein
MEKQLSLETLKMQNSEFSADFPLKNETFINNKFLLCSYYPVNIIILLNLVVKKLGDSKMAMQYSNLLKGFIQELDDRYILMKKKQDDSKLEVEYIFKDMHDQKLGSMKESIDDILTLIEERKKLREEIFNDMDGLTIKINNFLNEQKDSLKPEEIMELKKKTVEIEEAKSQEKLNAWRDVSNLKKELREHMKEFRDQKDGFKMLESIVDF